MKQGLNRLILLAGLCLLIASANAGAQGKIPKDDPFQGKLFAPNVILEHQDALELTRDQFTAIRAAVVAVQGNVAEYEWDLREAYQRVLRDLDENPIDEAQVLANVEKALLAENEVKKQQVALLIQLRNLLTDEQLNYLRSIN